MSEQVPTHQLTLIILVADESRPLAKLLDEVYHQDFPMDKLEVAVIDGGTDRQACRTAESFRGRFGSLKILDTPSRLAAAGKNVGIKNTTGPCLVILDTNACLPAKTVLRDLVDVFAATDADCLSCLPMPCPADTGEFQAALRSCRRSAIGDQAGEDAYSDSEGEIDPVVLSTMYRRAVFEKVGYFDDTFDGADDLDLNFRVRQAGLKSFLSPKLQIGLSQPANLGSLWRQMVRRGIGRFHFAHKHRRQSLADWVLGGGLLVTMLAGVLSLMFPSVFSVLRLILGLYVLLIVFFSGHLAVKQKNLSCLLYGPLIFLTLHVGQGLGLLIGWHRQFVRRPQ